MKKDNKIRLYTIIAIGMIVLIGLVFGSCASTAYMCPTYH